MIVQFVDQKEKKFRKKYWQEILKMEKLHPKQLAWTNADKKFYFEVDDGNAIWMTIDGFLVAEVLWELSPESKKGHEIAYICSSSVIKSHQGKGYGRILKQYLYNFLKISSYTEVRGHAKEGKSWQISKKMGAKLIKKIENYWQTGETYYYYKQKL